MRVSLSEAVSVASGIFVFALGAAVYSPAWAQGQQTARLLGTIERASGTTLAVKTSADVREVAIAPNTTVFGMVKATLADVKPGVFVGVGATPQSDGSQQAIRVMIFPESMRGLGEGHRPWDRPGTTMTNATVETAVSGVEGQVLRVRYRGGEQKIVIGQDASLLTYVEGERAELKPGSAVSVSAVVKADGALEATRIVVGRGGVVPN